MLEHYQIHCKERMEVGIPPLPLSVQQTSELVDLLKTEHKESDLLLELLKRESQPELIKQRMLKLAFLRTSRQARQTTHIFLKKKM